MTTATMSTTPMNTPPMKTKAVLFDLDGTLADTVPLIAEHIAMAVTAFGVPIEPGVVVPYIGRPLLVPLLELSGLPETDPRIDQMVRAYHETWAGAVNEQGHELLLPGVHGMLQQLRAAGYGIGVVTAKETAGARYLLEAIGIDGDIDVIVGTDQVEHGKPAPDSVLLALNLLGAPAADTWYVGDATSDMEMALAAGMRAMGITTGAAPHAALVAAGAGAVVATADEVARVVLG